MCVSSQLLARVRAREIVDSISRSAFSAISWHEVQRKMWLNLFRLVPLVSALQLMHFMAQRVRTRERSMLWVSPGGSPTVTRGPATAWVTTAWAAS